MTSTPSLYLELVAEPGDAHQPSRPRVPLVERPLHIGRAPDNGLVLAEDTVSWQHATVWVERGEIRVRDRESTNGTWIDEARLDGEGTVRPGQVLRLGRHARLRVVSTSPSTVVTVPAWRLEVLASGASVTVPAGGLRVGSGPNVDLSLPLEEVVWFEMRPLADGAEITSETGERRAVKAGVPFEVGHRHFRVLPAEGPTVPTVGERSPTDAYRLHVSLDGPTGPDAVLSDPSRGLAHRVSAENRAVILYLLATRLVEDRAARMPEPRQGWLGDEEVASGVWGREALRMDANNLNVILHRLRRELTDVGFDTSFIERRNRAVRIRLIHVTRS